MAEPCDCCHAEAWELRFTENSFDLRRCDVCGLHSVSPMPAEAERMTAMEDGHYAGDLKVAGAERWVKAERRRRAEFAQYVDLVRRHAPTGAWIDVGCGTGTLISLAREAGIQADGIELTADRRAEALATGAVIYDKPIEQLPVSDLAAVTMINVFSHLTSPRTTLTHIHGQLQTGGVLLLHTGVLGPGIERRHGNDWSLGDHLHWLGPGTIDRYASDIGYRIVERDAVWQPEAMWRRERLLLAGRSRSRDLVKRAIAYTPGALPLIRWWKLRDRSIPYHLATIVLQKI